MIGEGSVGVMVTMCSGLCGYEGVWYRQCGYDGMCRSCGYDGK